MFGPRPLIIFALMLAAAPAVAQINTHQLNICAEEDKQTGYLPPPSGPIGIPTTGGFLTGTLVAVTPFNPAGDLFTPLGVDRNIPFGVPEPEIPERADLRVDTTFNPATVPAGQTVLYVADIGNDGPDSATGVQLTVNLASGLTVQSAEPTQGSCATSGNRVICGMGALLLATQARLQLTLSVGSDARGTLNTTASVSADQPDPNPANNQASSALLVEAPAPQNADLSVTKSVTPQQVRVGERATYQIDVRNAGPGNATGVRVTDALPAGLSVVSATSTQGTCSGSGGSATCNLGSLASGGQARMTVEVSVGQDAQRSSVNTATVVGDQPDPVSTNNQASATLTVDPPEPTADLQVTKTGSPDPVRVGQLLRYTIVVNNLGPSEATNVLITDTLPQGTEFANCSPNCEPGDVIVRCHVDRIAPGGNGGAFIDVRPTQAGTITNRVTVEGEQRDPNTANNTATRTTTVNP